MNTVDIIIIVVIGIFALTGYFRGLINTLFNMLSFVISIALTYFLFPFVSRFIMNSTPIFNKLSESISKAFDLDNIIKSSVNKEEQLNIIQSLGIPKGTREMLVNNNNPDVFKLLDANTFKEYISKSLASLAVNVIVFVILFILISIVLTILVSVMNLITKATHLDQVNKFSGAIVGTLMGLLFVFIGLAVIAFILSTKNQANLLAVIDKSTIGSYLYNNNPIIDFLSNDIENNHFWKIISSVRMKSLK